MKSGARIWVLGVVLAGVGAGGALAQTNMVVNGGFEGGKAGVQSFANWDWIGPADNNSDYGVAQSSAAPDVAEQGNFYAYFHGHDGRIAGLPGAEHVFDCGEGIHGELLVGNGRADGGLGGVDVGGDWDFVRDRLFAGHSVAVVFSEFVERVAVSIFHDEHHGDKADGDSVVSRDRCDERYFVG